MAGVFIGLKLSRSGADEGERKRQITKCAFFTAGVLIFVCCLSGFWAIIGGLVGGEFELGVIRFNFTVTIIIALTLAGGFVLAFFQYQLTKAAAAATLRFTNRLN